MRKELIFVIVVGLALLVYDFQRPSEPSEILTVEIVSLEAAPEGKGWRLISVRMPDGSERTIKTLAPFFYKPGYLAHVGVFKRRVYPDIYDLVATPTAMPAEGQEG